MAALSLSLNFTLANDLLFKASNGRLSENSVGVKKLSDAEMSEVKGGLSFAYYSKQEYINSRGQKLQYRYYTINLDSIEKSTGAIFFNDGSNGSSNYNSFRLLSQMGTPMVREIYNEDTRTTTYAVFTKSRSGMWTQHVLGITDKIIKKFNGGGRSSRFY